jgi:hypothetical protein
LNQNRSLRNLRKLDCNANRHPLRPDVSRRYRAADQRPAAKPRLNQRKSDGTKIAGAGCGR